MSEEKIEGVQINVTPDASGKVTILHGKALDPKPLVPVQIVGTIDAPERFWELRKGDFDPKKCHVILTDRSIELVLNEDQPFTKGSVAGVLTMNEETSKWGINDPKCTYGNQDLAKLIKANEYLFANHDEWSKVYNSLSKFNANVNIAITDVKESSGDAEKARKITVEKKVPKQFSLTTRIYGKKREKYTVTLGAEVIGTTVEFYLDSSALAFKISELKDQMIEKHSEIFMGDVVVIQQ